MKEKSIFANPFRMLSPKLDQAAVLLDELHSKKVTDGVGLEEGLLITASKLIEMSRLLSKAAISGSASLMDQCAALAEDVHQQEQVLTKALVSSGAKGELLKSVIRFPFRLERVGDALENILTCCRVKAERAIPFSDKAHGEIEQLFAALSDMMNNLRDAFRAPNKVLLQAVISQGNKLNEMVEDFKLAHWERLEGGFCNVESSSVYRDMLDSFKMANEYITKMAETLLSLAQQE
ncbi:MAG: hypothetical protein V2B18_22180 [Pseudomonadota bacterium]